MSSVVFETTNSKLQWTWILCWARLCP